MNIKNTDIYDIFMANKDKLFDLDFLISVLEPHTRIKRMNLLGSRPRIGQFAREFCPWMIMLAKAGVKSYIEIGTSTGGSYYFMDSYLRAAVPGYVGAMGVNICFKIRGWPDYIARWPKSEYLVMNSKNLDLKDRQFDAAFIDANHRESWVLSDFGKVKNNAKIVGFHDIVLVNASVDAAWAKIKQQYSSKEFIDLSIPVAARCGIGVVTLH